MDKVTALKERVKALGTQRVVPKDLDPFDCFLVSPLDRKFDTEENVEARLGHSVVLSGFRAEFTEMICQRVYGPLTANPSVSANVAAHRIAYTYDPGKANEESGRKDFPNRDPDATAAFLSELIQRDQDNANLYRRIRNYRDHEEVPSIGV